MATKKKKEDSKPGPSTGGKVTSRINKAKGTQPLTLGTGGLRTSKISKKQMAGTRKAVVGAATALTGVGGAARVAATSAARAAARKEVKTAVSEVQKIAKGIMESNVRMNKRPNPKAAFATAAREYEKKQLTKKVVPPKPKSK